MSTKLGLALSGGGAKGIAHVGVLKVLEEAQIPVHFLAGTSMGGIVAAAYAAGRSPDEIAHTFRTVRLLDVLQWDGSGLGFIGQDKLAGKLRDVLGGDLSFDDLKRPLALVAADLETGEEVVIREGPLIDALLATAAVPVLFPPVRCQGRTLVDGGVLNLVPFDVARDMGADQVIAVHTTLGLSRDLTVEPEPSGHGAEAVLRTLLRRLNWTRMVEIAERSTTITSNKLVEQRIREAPPDLMIKIVLEGVGLLDLDKAELCVAIGEETARQHLAELHQLLDTSLPARLNRWWQSTERKLRRLR